MHSGGYPPVRPTPQGESAGEVFFFGEGREARKAQNARVQIVAADERALPEPKLQKQGELHGPRHHGSPGLD